MYARTPFMSSGTHPSYAIMSSNARREPRSRAAARTGKGKAKLVGINGGQALRIQRCPQRQSAHSSTPFAWLTVVCDALTDQVRVTRGKLASGSIVERPAVLTERKWDRPSSGAER